LSLQRCIIFLLDAFIDLDRPVILIIVKQLSGEYDTGFYIL